MFVVPSITTLFPKYTLHKHTTLLMLKSGIFNKLKLSCGIFTEMHFLKLGTLTHFNITDKLFLK